MDRQKIFIFLLLSFGLGLFATLIPYWFLDPGSMIFPFVWVLGFAWTPALAAIITQKYIYKGSMARYGWNRKRFSFSWIALSVFLPIGVILGSLGITFLAGNLLHIPGFGEVITNELARSLEGLQLFIPTKHMDPFLQFLSADYGWNLSGWAVAQGMPPELLSILVMLLVVGLISGLTVGLINTVGEEVGWRGFMLTETRSLGFIESNFLIGITWGLRNLLPFISFFMLFGGPVFLWDYIWEMIATVGYAVAVSFPLAWLASKTRSVYASATFSSIMNNLGGLSMIFLYAGNPLLTSSTGLAGMFVLLVITFLIIRFDKKFVEDYPALFY